MSGALKTLNASFKYSESLSLTVGLIFAGQMCSSQSSIHIFVSLSDNAIEAIDEFAFLEGKHHVSENEKTSGFIAFCVNGDLGSKTHFPLSLKGFKSFFCF